jgi:hypothetical protein
MGKLAKLTQAVLRTEEFLKKTYSSPLVINGGVKQKPTILPLI